MDATLRIDMTCPHCTEPIYAITTPTELARTTEIVEPARCRTCGKGYTFDLTITAHILEHTGLKRPHFNRDAPLAALVELIDDLTHDPTVSVDPKRRQRPKEVA